MESETLKLIIDDNPAADMEYVNGENITVTECPTVHGVLYWLGLLLYYYNYKL